LRKTTNANKIVIDKRQAKNNAKETKETKVKIKRTKANIEIDARVDIRATTTIVIVTTTITNKKRSLKLRKQFICTHVNLVLETTLILLSCLLLFNNSRKYINNTLYS